MASNKAPPITLDPRYLDMLEYERKQLKSKYKVALPGKELALTRLIEQTSRCKVLLDLEFEDISQNGTVELFSQSPSTPPYERERPVARLYISHEKNYMLLLKQLDSLVPQVDPKPETDELEAFMR